jgi:hypothetical protein
MSLVERFDRALDLDEQRLALAVGHQAHQHKGLFTELKVHALQQRRAVTPEVCEHAVAQPFDDGVLRPQVVQLGPGLFLGAGLAGMRAAWAAKEAVPGLDVLLVSPRKTSRYLLFDTDNRLQGWIHKDTLQTKPEGFVYEPGQYREYAFSGIHVISPELFHYMDGEAWKGKFPIMDFYLHTCRQLQLGGCIKEDLQLIDIGKPDTLARAEEFLKD